KGGRGAIPRTATSHASILLGVHPILAPLPYVPSHVVEAKLVRFETQHRRSGGETIGVAVNASLSGELLLEACVCVIPGAFGRRPLAAPRIAANLRTQALRGRVLRHLLVAANAHGETPLTIRGQTVAAP